MLTPIKHPRKNSFCVYDIETDKYGNMLDVAVYDGKEINIFDNWNSFLNFVFEKAKVNKQYRKLIAHNGGSFDHINLVEFISENRRDITVEVCLSQSKIVIMNIIKDSIKITFYDSYNVLLTSLKHLSEIFETKYRKIEIDEYSNMARFKKENKERYYEYLKNDVLCLWEVCNKFMQVLEIEYFPPTIASLSLYLFRYKFLKKALWKVRKKVDDFITQAYAGGRVEVLKEGSHDNVYVYDINSLYPYVMQKFDYPIGLPIYTRIYRKDKQGFYKIRFIQKNRNVPPVLWIKGIIGLQFVYSGEGIYSNVEINKLIEIDPDAEIHVYEGYFWNKSEKLFKEFVDYYYNLRMKNKDNCIGYICKIIMNSLYGKFAQKEKQERLIKISIDRKLSEIMQKYRKVIPYHDDWYVVEEDVPVHHRLIHLSAMITAYARIELYNYLHKYNRYIVYCDTDSLHSIIRINENIGKEIGKLKLEKSGNAYYAGRKSYQINDEVCIKGINSLTDDLKYLETKDKIIGYYTSVPKLKSVIKGKKSCVFETKIVEIRKNDYIGYVSSESTFDNFTTT